LERAVGLSPFITAVEVGETLEVAAGADDEGDAKRALDVEQKRDARTEGRGEMLVVRLYGDSAGCNRVGIRRQRVSAKFAARELLVVMRNLRQRESAGRIHNGRSRTRWMG
jgi:hypothetical protein